MRTVREEKEREKRGRRMTHHPDKQGNATQGKGGGDVRSYKGLRVCWVLLYLPSVKFHP